MCQAKPAGLSLACRFRCGQSTDGIIKTFHTSGEDPVLAVHDRVDTPEYRLGCSVLENYAMDAPLKRLDGIAVFDICGEQDHARGRRTKLLQNTKSGESRKADIQQQYIRLETLHERRNLVARGSFPNNTQMRLAFQQLSQTATKKCMIVRNHDTSLRHDGPLLFAPSMTVSADFDGALSIFSESLAAIWTIIPNPQVLPGPVRSAVCRRFARREVFPWCWYFPRPSNCDSEQIRPIRDAERPQSC